MSSTRQIAKFIKTLTFAFAILFSGSVYSVENSNSELSQLEKLLQIRETYVNLRSSRELELEALRKVLEETALSESQITSLQETVENIYESRAGMVRAGGMISFARGTLADLAEAGGKASAAQIPVLNYRIGEMSRGEILDQISRTKQRLDNIDEVVSRIDAATINLVVSGKI